MQYLSFGPAEILLLAVVLVVALAVAGVAVGRRRRRAAAEAEAAGARQAAGAAEEDRLTRLPSGREPGGRSWRAPQQPQPPPPAGGPALSAGIMSIRREGETLQVAWNAINDGSVPLAVQWGQPAVDFDGKRVFLRYAWAPGAEGPDGQPAAAEAFAPPRSRVCGPGEILSRDVNVDWPAGSRDLGGLEVQVLVGYGPADGLPAASIGRAEYLAWQKIAATRPRPVPAFRPSPQP